MRLRRMCFVGCVGHAIDCFPCRDAMLASHKLLDMPFLYWSRIQCVSTDLTTKNGWRWQYFPIFAIQTNQTYIEKQIIVN